MLTLGLDTTGAYCSAALVDSAKIHAYAADQIHRGHAERLGPMVQDLFKQANIKAKDLGRVSVCVGPGSFTGVRVGLAFAKGLALPWDIPMSGVSGLEVWARSADPEGQTTLLACADVRRNDLFWQIWDHGTASGEPVLSSKDDVPTTFNVVGSGSEVLGKSKSSDFICPALVGWLGARSDQPAAPLYHRPPDAKLPGGRTLKT